MALGSLPLPARWEVAVWVILRGVVTERKWIFMSFISATSHCHFPQIGQRNGKAEAMEHVSLKVVVPFLSPLLFLCHKVEKNATSIVL
jgi:hypothetical protein